MNWRTFKMKTLLLAALITSASAMAGWEHKSRIDPMTDSDRSYVGIVAAKDAAAVVRCEDGQPHIVFVFDYLGDRYPNVTVRFDKREPKEIDASPSARGSARFIGWTHTSEMLHMMKTSQKVAVRATNYRGASETIVIPLGGFKEQVAKLACVK